MKFLCMNPASLTEILSNIDKCRAEIAFGPFGAIAGSTVQGLMAIQELLSISNEGQISGAIVGLLDAIVDQHRDKL